MAAFDSETEINSQRIPVSAATRSLQERAHHLIPGGGHTYAKGDDQFPLIAPPFLERGAGCRVWDLDGNQYIEYGMGLRAVTLGHAHGRVNEAAARELARGQNFCRPSSLEVRAAEALLEMVPGAEMAKFSRNGSDVTSAAVRLARAFTHRDLIAICRDQPFFSTDDWFIGTTPMRAGIPSAIRELTLTFPFNDLAALRALFDAHPGRIACVIMEAETSVAPQPGYLEGVGSLCRETGALWVLDEMITGFRLHNGGAQTRHGVSPDLSTFGKGIANGFAVAALVGRREVMELGGLRHDRERVFLLSNTHGAESSGLGASMEAMRIYQNEPVIETLARQGARLRTGVEQAITAAGVGAAVQLLGHPANIVFATRDSAGAPSQAFRALFMQELIRRGVIGPSFVVSAAHADDDIDFTIGVVAEALRVYARALSAGVDGLLEGPPLKRVFRAFN